MKSSLDFSLWFLLTAVILVSLLLPFASEHPDGLVKVAEILGFSSEQKYITSPVPDYDAMGNGSYLSFLIAMTLGVAITLLLGLVMGYLLRKENAP